MRQVGRTIDLLNLVSTDASTCVCHLILINQRQSER